MNQLPELPVKNSNGKLPKWRRKKQAVQARQVFSFRMKRKEPTIFRCVVLAICEAFDNGENGWTLRKKGETCDEWAPFAGYDTR